MSYVPNATASFSRETTYASSTRPFFIPTGDIVIDVSGNAVFPEDVTVGKDLIVDESASIGLSLTTGGNITAAGTIAADTSFYQGTATSDSYMVLQTDNVGNSEFQQVARDTGDGQAYHDLITLKPITGPHNFRRLIGMQGDCYLQNNVNSVTQQQMYWDAAGTEMLFNFGATNALRLNTNGLKAPAYVTINNQNPNIVANATTSIFTIAAASIPVGKPVHIPINLYFFDGAITQEYFVTYIINAARTGANISAYVENQTTADAALLAQTGAAWTLAVTGSGTPTLSVDITTLAAPVPSGGWFCNFNYTNLGAQ